MSAGGKGRVTLVLAALTVFALALSVPGSLREFWERHRDAEQPLRAWYHDAWKADWRSPADLKRGYANASIIAEKARNGFDVESGQRNSTRLAFGLCDASGIRHDAERLRWL